MERYHHLLLAVWREACRHIEIDQSLTNVAEMLGQAMPLETLTLYSVDEVRGRLERLSFINVAGGLPVPPPPVLSAAQTDEVVLWCKTTDVAGWTGRVPPAGLAQELLSGVGPNGLAIALASEEGALGLLLLGGPEPFSEREQRLAGLLREPIAVALENDRRFHELMTLREAAEADKRKLLHRLGRDQLTDEIIGADGGLKAVLERVHLVSRSDVPVLIFGETGSGKEVIARAIHEGSGRAGGPFIRVNCGAIPSELIDSELFGHERGSFTGAVAERKGWFERAHGGTLFLDEIGELPSAAQVRLLRVLQDSTFERVGGQKALHVNVRIVAATHRDLARMVQQHAFREDLWYRVAVFPIVLPPLRERRQDIPALAEFFAQRAARRFGLRLQRPTDADIALLTGYDWPGNVREFASVLDRAAILGDGSGLEMAKALGIVAPSAPGPGPVSLEHPPSGEAVLPTLDEAMRTHIEQALAVCAGRIEGPRGAATRLAINPHTLRARMRKLGINWTRFR